MPLSPIPVDLSRQMCPQEHLGGLSKYDFSLSGVLHVCCWWFRPPHLAQAISLPPVLSLCTSTSYSEYFFLSTALLLYLVLRSEVNQKERFTAVLLYFEASKTETLHVLCTAVQHCMISSAHSSRLVHRSSQHHSILLLYDTWHDNEQK